MAEHHQPYIVNVEGLVRHNGRYLMVVRGPEETHAAGLLAPPGGCLELTAECAAPLEATVRREILEETGITIGPVCHYLESKIFGEPPCLDVVFLCSYQSGTPTITDPGEVAEILWLTAAEIRAHSQTPPWTKQSLTLAEAFCATLTEREGDND